MSERDQKAERHEGEKMEDLEVRDDEARDIAGGAKKREGVRYGKKAAAKSVQATAAPKKLT